MRIVLFAFFLYLLPIDLFAQASLAAENIIDDISVTTADGKRKVYTVFRDARMPNQWYYIPNELRVAEEITAGGQRRPKMTILRYQYAASADSSIQGGILVAAFTYAMEAEVVEKVKDQIKTRKGISAAITLSAIPFNSSTIDFLSSSNDFIGNVQAASNISGATSASQEMVISYDLTELGANVFTALASSRGGIPIRGNFTYNGLTPPCGYTIKGKWDNVYNYFERQSVADTRFKFWNVSGGGVVSKSSVTESLKSIQDMQVTVTECQAPGGDSAGGVNPDEAAMNTVISTIQKEVFNDSMMTRATELARLQALYQVADTAEKRRLEGLIASQTNAIQFGYQRSTKSVSKRRRGEVSYDFTRQRMITRPSSIGGVLSFSKYGLSEQQLIDQGYIIDLDANAAFPSVVFGLPVIPAEWNLRSVTLNVSTRFSNGTTKSEARQWTSAGGWQTPTNAKVGYMRFNMIGEPDRVRAKEPEFNIKLQVVSAIPGASFTIEKTEKAGGTQRFIDALEVLTEQVVVDPQNLDFTRVTALNSDLSTAQVTFTKGSMAVNKIISPFFSNGAAGAPMPFYILTPKNEQAGTGTVVYKMSNGQTVSRRIPLSIGENVLENSDWKIVQ